MNKYYKVLKDTFIWSEGAILKYDPTLGNGGGYRPIEDVWDKNSVGAEYISTKIIEDNPEWFERVYESKAGKMVFLTAEKFKESINFTN